MTQSQEQLKNEAVEIMELIEDVVEYHCDEKCMKKHKDGDGKDIIIECCKHCRCDEC